MSWLLPLAPIAFLIVFGLIAFQHIVASLTAVLS